MRLRLISALVVGVLAPVMAPAALATGPTYGTPECEQAPPPHAKAHGFYCKGQSKKHVKGQQGTSFSRCVKGVAQLRKDREEEKAAQSV